MAGQQKPIMVYCQFQLAEDFFFGYSDDYYDYDDADGRIGFGIRFQEMRFRKVNSKEKIVYFRPLHLYTYVYF